ncbi:PilN domain-containing protein [Brassicibacter mesophilus]|uniref:PilN domain-containing protein n=1 Tax=Brassicibacter mesophilus TaxID=745119 RepID=UPI003D216019
MNDMNFFQYYYEKKENCLNKDTILYGIIILLMIGIVGYVSFNFVKISRLTAEAAALKQQVEIKKADKKITEILQKEREINEFGEKLMRLKILDEYINSNDIINEYLLDAITMRVPETVFLNSMTLTSNSITIEGTSKDKIAISDFQHRLGELEQFETIFIPTILHQNNYYSFIMSIQLQEGRENGDQDIN